MEKTLVKNSLIEGKGLFAICDIAKDETIFLVTGPTVKYPTSPNGNIGQNWLNVGHNEWKISDGKTNWNFLNHSCAPNAGLKGRTRLVAMRPIRAGEEITMDYSCAESHEDWKLRCNCSHKNCRKTIRSVQYLPAILFDTYRSYIPRFLRKMYESEKTYKQPHANAEGIYAKNVIKKDEVIFTVSGPKISYKETPDYTIGYKWLAVGKNKWIMPYRKNPWWSMRHSCDPNTGLRNGTQVIALRGILPDEEVTIDDSICEADPRWKHRCHCGAANCRKVVRSIQFLPEDTFKKYTPYIPEFLQELRTQKV